MSLCRVSPHSYLQGGSASVLPADGVPVVGPHDLVDSVALRGEGLLWRHHPQLLQLSDTTRALVKLSLEQQYQKDTAPITRKHWVI